MHLQTFLNEYSELNNHFWQIPLEKLSYENKTAVLLGDFNSHSLNYDINTDISHFLDCMYCNSLLPHITSPTHIIASSQTLIDNIFSNASDSTFKSGNLLTIPSDHNVQFLFLENQIKTQKGNTTVDFTAMEKQKNEINEQLPNINWAAELRLHKNNVYLSIDLLLKKNKKLNRFMGTLTTNFKY